VNEKPDETYLEEGVANKGWDDDRGDFRYKDGDHIAYRYEIIKRLGKGSFG
jgi:dual specificity tyrosine-phosphorylation-regulated kinase 2/3/4